MRCSNDCGCAEAQQRRAAEKLPKLIVLVDNFNSPRDVLKAVGDDQANAEVVVLECRGSGKQMTLVDWVRAMGARARGQKKKRSAKEGVLGMMRRLGSA